MGIDPGTRYVGLAVSNPERTIAFPLTVLAATPKRALLAAIGQAAAERKVDQFVVGRPVALRGTPLPMTSVAEALGTSLTTALKLPVALVDERLSSKEATVTAPSKKRIDAHAAAVFLQTYLDRQHV